jgi:hypothetical protein
MSPPPLLVRASFCASRIAARLTPGLAEGVRIHFACRTSTTEARTSCAGYAVSRRRIIGAM